MTGAIKQGLPKLLFEVLTEPVTLLCGILDRRSNAFVLEIAACRCVCIANDDVDRWPSRMVSGWDRVVRSRFELIGGGGVCRLLESLLCLPFCSH
jgi:hypothetical protein